MTNLLQVSYDEVIRWGEPPKYKNFTYTGVTLGVHLDDGGYNDVSVKVDGNQVTRTYTHFIGIPDNFAEALVDAASDMMLVAPGHVYDPDTHMKILNSYRNCCRLLGAFMYHPIMNELIRTVSFQPSEDDWRDHVGDPTKDEEGTPRENTVMLMDDGMLVVRFTGTVPDPDKEGERRDIVYMNGFSIPFMIHNLFLSFNMMEIICSGMGLTYTVPEMPEDSQDTEEDDMSLQDMLMEEEYDESDDAYEGTTPEEADEVPGMEAKPEDAEEDKKVLVSWEKRYHEIVDGPFFNTDKELCKRREQLLELIDDAINFNADNPCLMEFFISKVETTVSKINEMLGVVDKNKETEDTDDSKDFGGNTEEEATEKKTPETYF